MPGLAAEVIKLLERLPVTQGGRVGELLTVLPWQRRLVRGIIGSRTSAISVARGNGKTTICAGLAVASLIGPLRQRRGETIVAASSHSQARITFEHVIAFMDGLIKAHPRRFRIADSQNVASIEDRETGCRVRCIGSDPRRAHGLAPVLTLVDEPAQHEYTKTDAMVAALRTAAGKIPGSRFVALGTRPADHEHWFSRMLSGGAGYAQCHAAGPDDPPFRKATWRKANPSLGHMPDLEAAIRAEAREARADPSMLASLSSLRLNLGTSDVMQSTLLDAGTWQRIEGPADEPAIAPGYCLGVDLGTSAAMSACAAYDPFTGDLSAVAAFPEIPSLAERGLADGVGRLYTECARRGELIVAGERVSDIPTLLRTALDRWGRPGVIVCDRWREAELRQTLTAMQFPLAQLVVRGQGYRDGAEDVRGFRAACLAGHVRPRQSLLLRAAVGEARVVMDPAGNAKLAKGSQGARRLRARDDAAAAAILAVAEGARRRADGRPQRRWRYAGMAG